MNGLDISPAGLRIEAQFGRLSIREQHAVLRIVGALVRNPPPRYRVADGVSISDLMAELGFSSFTDAAAVADLVNYIGTITAVDVATALDTLAEMGLQSVDDAAAVLENLQQLMFLGTQADAATAADGVITLMTSAQAEAVTMAEVVLGLFSIPFADAASAADALSTALSFNPINDGAGTADAFTFFGKVDPVDAITAVDTSKSAVIGLPSMWARPGEFYPGAARPGAARATIQPVGALSDGAASADAVLTVATRAQADAATSSDAASWMGTVGVSDALLPYEAISVVIPASVADGAAAAEAATQLGAMSMIDGASVADAALQSLLVQVADGVGAVEGASISGLSAQASDAAVPSDAATPFGFGAQADSATPVDVVSSAISIQQNDSATATESATPTGGLLSVADAATVSEAAAPLGSLSVADSATSSENRTITFTKLQADSATVAEAATVLGKMSMADGATAAEAAATIGKSTVADSATSTESAAISTGIILADGVTATESASYVPTSGPVVLLDLNGTPYDRAVGANWSTTGTQTYTTGPFSGSQAYDGSSLTDLPRIDSPTSASANLGTGIFAIEFFLKATKIPGNSQQYQWIMGSGLGDLQWGIYIYDYDGGGPTDGAMYFGVNSSFDGFVSTDFNAFLGGGWKFVQIIRDGDGRISMRFGGGLDTETFEVGASTDYASANITSSYPLSVGSVYNDNSPGVGGISSLRITKGSIPSFTIPTGPWP